MADTNLRIKIGMVGSADVNAGLRAIGSAAAGLQATLAGIAASVGAVVSLGAAIQQSVKFNAELEQQAVAFKTLLGNAEAASRRMAELAKFAAQTPFELPEIVQASRVLQSLTNGALASGDGLRLVGDAASATGRPLEEAAMWIGRLYAGLQSGTPVGEATLRLLEMGLISGTTARKLNELAESGEGAGQAMTILRDTFGRLGGAMADQSQTFSGLLSTLKDTFNMALADIGKPLFDALKAGLTELIPVVEDIGTRIGAFTRLAVQSWRDGRFAELIGLTIEAGVEYGVEAFAGLRDKVLSFFTDERVANAIGNSAATLAVGTARAFIELNTFFQSYWNSVGVYAAQAIGSAIRLSINAVLASVSVATLGRINLPLIEQTTPNFDAALAGGTAIAQANAAKQKEIVDALLETYREFIGIESSITDESGKQVTAREKLKTLIDQVLAVEKSRKDLTGGAQAVIENESKLINVKLELQKLELEYSRQLQQINQSRGAIESSWLTTNLVKYQEKKRLFQNELDLIAKQITALEKLKATATETERVQIEQRVVGLQGTAGGVRNQMTGMGPDPQSMGENFQATLINLQNQFGTVAQQMAATFADVFNAATASISTGIQGLIMGTMSWGQALQNIGLSIVNSIVKSFADMVAGWIMSHVIMKGVSTAWSGFQTMLRGKDVVEANATELAKTPALAANATLASIGSYGVAAVIGIAAIAGILAMIGGFKEGGYTGDGNPNDVAGIVHRGEYVVPADAVDRIGLSSLNAMASGGVSDAGAFTSAAAPGPITLNMGVFDNPARLNDWARSNEGRTVLVDIMRQHSHEFSRA
jgi:hypothetical protein